MAAKTATVKTEAAVETSMPSDQTPRPTELRKQEPGNASQFDTGPAPAAATVPVSDGDEDDEILAEISKDEPTDESDDFDEAAQAPIPVRLALSFFGNCFHRIRVVQHLVAIDHLLPERLESTPEVRVANGSIHVFNIEGARNEHWRRMCQLIKLLTHRANSGNYSCRRACIGSIDAARRAGK
jgi:hypothetical protein